MPIPMPPYAMIMSLGVRPDSSIAFARSVGGLIVTSRRGDPFWRGRFTTVPLAGRKDDNKHADFCAFLSWCTEHNYAVDFVHPRHRLPGAYTAATWPMAGDGAIVSLTDLYNVVVSGLTMALTLRRGDRVSFVQGDHIVHRWIAADVVVSSTSTQTIEVTPRLPIGLLEAGADVVLEDPIMRLRIVPGSWDADEVADPTPISFEVSESTI